MRFDVCEFICWRWGRGCIKGIKVEGREESMACECANYAIKIRKMKSC